MKSIRYGWIEKKSNLMRYVLVTTLVTTLLPSVVHNQSTTYYQSKSMLTDVSAYNVGVVEQNDDSPCIGASSIDLCRLVNLGVHVCAYNQVPLGSMIEIEDYGYCLVLDRTHLKYENRVDIAMKKQELIKARTWGIKKLKVIIW